jgi:ABC-type lipoprotein export system ATPase subunit
LPGDLPRLPPAPARVLTAQSKARKRFGEILAVMGAGKSSAMRIIGCVSTATAEDFEILGLVLPRDRADARADAGDDRLERRESTSPCSW